jgi:hypothetical protein
MLNWGLLWLILAKEGMISHITIEISGKHQKVKILTPNPNPKRRTGKVF